MVKVIFVCLGNIVRSPMAEAVFQKKVDKAGLSHEIEVDSAGTGNYHVGEHAHPETLRILAEVGISCDSRARQIVAKDMAPENYIIALDQKNVQNLRYQFGEHARLYRLLDFAGDASGRDVPDAYYTGNFEYVYELVDKATDGLLDFIRQENRL